MAAPLRDRHATRGKVPKLDAPEIARLLPEVPGWKVEGGELRRSLELATFQATIAFVNAVAALAEAEDHHPDFAIHYRKLDLSLSTHSAGGLSENDFILAARIDALPGRP